MHKNEDVPNMIKKIDICTIPFLYIIYIHTFYIEKDIRHLPYLGCFIIIIIILWSCITLTVSFPNDDNDLSCGVSDSASTKQVQFKTSHGSVYWKSVFFTEVMSLSMITLNMISLNTMPILSILQPYPFQMAITIIM